MTTQKSPNEQIEEGVGLIWGALYRLRQAGEYKEEYNSMGAILNMLMQDRAHLKSIHPEVEYQ